MMTLLNRIVLVGCIVSISSIQAQLQNNSKEFVYSFFDAFHNRDTVALSSYFSSEARLVSIQYRGEKPILNEESADEFLEAIGAIPADLRFEERLGDLEIISAEGMVIVASPYSFYVNENFSHCGTNVFTLLPDGDSFTIVALYDTRLKACSSNRKD